MRQPIEPAGPRNEYGRFHLRINTATDTAQLVIENINHKGEHWLVLSTSQCSRGIIGYLRLSPIDLSHDQTRFVVCEVRPADGPLPFPEDALSEPEAPVREGTE